MYNIKSRKLRVYFWRCSLTFKPINRVVYWTDFYKIWPKCYLDVDMPKGEWLLVTNSGKSPTHSICSLLIDTINFAMNAIKFQTLLILLFRAWVHLPLDKISKIVLCQILHYVKVFLLYSTLLRFYYTSNAYTCRCYFLEETLEGLL